MYPKAEVKLADLIPTFGPVNKEDDELDPATFVARVKLMNQQLGGKSKRGDTRKPAN